MLLKGDCKHKHHSDFNCRAYTCICICTYEYAHVCIYIYTYCAPVFTLSFTHLCMHIIHINVYIYMYIHTSIYLLIYSCMCMAPPPPDVPTLFQALGKEGFRSCPQLSLPSWVRRPQIVLLPIISPLGNKCLKSKSNPTENQSASLGFSRALCRCSRNFSKHIQSSIPHLTEIQSARLSFSQALD